MRNTIALAIVAVMALAGSGQAATLEEILAKNLAARGGEARLKEIKTLKMTGRLIFGGDGFGFEAAWGQLQKRGSAGADLMRNEVTVQGLTQMQAYDGREGWSIQPFQGRLDAEKASDDDARGFAQQAEIDGPLIDWRAKGHRIEYLGVEDTDGTPAIKLRVTRKDGDLQYVYLDPDSYLEIRITTVNKVRGAERISEADLGGYEQVNGVWFPFAIEAGAKGAPRSARIIVDRAEANGAVDEAWFKLPPPKTRVAAVVTPSPGEARVAVSAPPPQAAGEKVTF